MGKGNPHLAEFVYMLRPVQIMHPLAAVLGEEGRDEGGEGSDEGGECRVKALADRCLGQRKWWERECWGDKHVYRRGQ